MHRTLVARRQGKRLPLLHACTKQHSHSLGCWDMVECVHQSSGHDPKRPQQETQVAAAQNTRGNSRARGCACSGMTSCRAHTRLICMTHVTRQQNVRMWNHLHNVQQYGVDKLSRCQHYPHNIYNTNMQLCSANSLPRLNQGRIAPAGRH